MEPPSSARPILAVLAVVLRGEAVLLVQRANPPDAGLWGFPGGKMEFGETLLAAAERELHEETGVRAAAQAPFTAVEAHDVSKAGDLRRHFVLVAVECHWQAGEPVAADDAQDAAWVPLAELGHGLPLSRDVARLARQAAARRAP